MTQIEHYDVGVYRGAGEYQSLRTNLPPTTTSYDLYVTSNQIYIFEVKAHDLSGNVTTRRQSVYTEGYEFPHSYVFSVFFKGD